MNCQHRRTCPECMSQLMELMALRHFETETRRILQFYKAANK